MLEAIGVLVLHIPLYAFWTEFAEVEGKVLPRLPADDLVVTHSQLNAALLAAKAAVGLHHLVLFFGRDPSAGGNAVEAGAKLFDDVRNFSGNFSHTSQSCEALSFRFGRAPQSILAQG